MKLTPAERKRAQRDRERSDLKKYGGRRISFLAYGGTLEKIEAICLKNGFTGQQRIAEAITFLIEKEEK